MAFILVTCAPSASRKPTQLRGGCRVRIKNTKTLKQPRTCMNYLVVMEAAWLVRDVEDIDDAIGVAISESGKRLNQEDMDYVEVDVGATFCPACGEPFDSAYVAADTALVGLELEIEVFNAESEEHAQRIAKSDVGGALKDVPLKVVATEPQGEDEEN
jgi:uncharacterized protein (UPF0212 family)